MTEYIKQEEAPLKLFIASKEFREVVREIYEADLNVVALEILQTYRIEENINYLGISEENPDYISYLNASRINNLSEDEYWMSNKRYHGKPGKVLEMLFPGKFTDMEKQTFTERFRNRTARKTVDSSIVKIVEGEKILHYYLEDNYCESKEGSELHNSCMRYGRCQDYFDIYTKNDRFVSLAVILNSRKKVKARCIIWYPETKKDTSVIYYDRIYAVDTKTAQEMQAALDNMGMISCYFKNNGGYIEKNITITLDCGQFDIKEFPYLDTFRWIDGKNITNEEKNDWYCLDSTDGNISSPEGNNIVECCDCGDLVPEDDAYYIEIGPSRDSYCCSGCSSYSEYHGDRIADRDSVTVEYDNDRVLLDDVIKDYNGNFIIAEKSVMLYDGDYTHEDDDDLIESNDGRYFISGDSAFIIPEGSDNYYHIDSSDVELINDTYYLVGSDEWEEITEQLKEEENV